MKETRDYIFEDVDSKRAAYGLRSLKRNFETHANIFSTDAENANLKSHQSHYLLARFNENPEITFEYSFHITSNKDEIDLFKAKLKYPDSNKDLTLLCQIEDILEKVGLEIGL